TVLYGDFGAGGIWKWDGTAWNRISADNPQAMIASGSMLYVNLGGTGIWKWDGASWSQITATDPAIMVSAY
ncbi:MAG TPA: hypothetical protein PK036_14250, partial [Geobacteraceae bacterium]|nr:hypothetical protein [Geobacteraceae bacterium]